MRYILQIILSILIFAMFSSCNKPFTPNATLYNASGLDGCGWMIKLNNGKLLEPENLKDFVSNPTENEPIQIEYVSSNFFSICMSGLPIKILSLKK